MANSDTLDWATAVEEQEDGKLSKQVALDDVFLFIRYSDIRENSVTVVRENWESERSTFSLPTDGVIAYDQCHYIENRKVSRGAILDLSSLINPWLW